MNRLIENIEENMSSGLALPYSIYSSVHEQRLLNVPIAKPLLVVVLNGRKELGKEKEIQCCSSQFVFLSDRPSINMRNVPIDALYQALLIEFEYEDFVDIPPVQADKLDYFVGDASSSFTACLSQFVECSAWAAPTIISSRRKEILTLLYLEGFHQLTAMVGKSKVSHKLYDLYVTRGFYESTTELICHLLAMSESTLRRRLKNEGTSIQKVKDSAKLSTALSLLQTSDLPISYVAEACGYQSQSRFTERFKLHFDLTPSELRKTQLKG